MLSGELKSFHQVQLARLGVRNRFPDYGFVLNLSVNDALASKVFMMRATEKAKVASVAKESDVHRLRNELNRFIVGVQFMIASLQMGDVKEAREVGEILLDASGIT